MRNPNWGMRWSESGWMFYLWVAGEHRYACSGLKGPASEAREMRDRFYAALTELGVFRRDGHIGRTELARLRAGDPGFPKYLYRPRGQGRRWTFEFRDRPRFSGTLDECLAARTEFFRNEYKAPNEIENVST